MKEKLSSLTTKQKLLYFSVLPGTFALIFTGIGFLLGRYSVTLPFKFQIEALRRAETLGQLLNRGEESEVAAVYDEGAEDIDFDTISWSVANVPAPFVGHIPDPRAEENASINSLQIRAPGEVAMPKPANVYRIVMTGGSTAYGSGATSYNTTIAGYLSAHLNEALSPETGLAYEVLIFANPAWASTHERIIIENRVLDLDADLVVAFSGNNDVHWGWLGQDVFWFRSYYDQHYWNLLNTVYEISGYEGLPEIVPPIVDPPISPPIDCSIVSDRLLRNINLTSHALSLDGIKYVFVLQPTLAVTEKPLSEREAGYLDDAARTAYFRACYEGIASALPDFQAPLFSYLNLAGIFDTSDQELFIDSFHFGDKGNALIAASIFDAIKGEIRK